MTRGGGRRAAVTVLLAGLLAALLAASVLVAVPGPARADSSGVVPGDATCPAGVPPATGGVPSAVDVRVTGIDPVAPQPHSLVTVTALLRNVSGQPIDHLQVRLRLAYRPEGSRAAVESDARSTAPFDSDVPAGGVWTAETPVPPGDCRVATLRLDTDRIGFPTLQRPGVYRLGVEADRVMDGFGLVPLGRQNTFLPWMPAGQYKPEQVLWLWPLVDQPRIAPDGALLNDGLAAEIAPGGRLAELVAAAVQESHRSGTILQPVAGHPAGAAGGGKPAARPHVTLSPVTLTYAIDPALLEALAAMATGHYRVHTGGSTTGKVVTSDKGSADAKALLATLHTLVTPANLLALPYGDPDYSALVRAGAEAQVRNAENARDAVLTATAFPRVVAAFWPPGGMITPQALDETSAPAVVLSAGAVRGGGAHTAVTTLSRSGGPITALVGDAGLSSLVTGTADPSTGLLDRQLFLAETAAQVAAAPQAAALTVITPPHRFDPRGTRATALLRLTGQLPWMLPISLADAVAGSMEPSGAPGVLRYPASARASELPQEYLDQIMDTGDRVEGLRSMLCPASDTADAGSCRPDPVVLPLEHALLEATSSAWRDNLGTGQQYYRGTADEVRRVLDHVHVTSAGTVTLLSQSGSIPVTIANDLTMTVGVRLHVTTPNPAVLSVHDDTVLVVPPGVKSTQTVQAHTSSAGRAKFPIYVQLETPDGQPIGPPTQLVVRATGFGEAAVAITGGALAVLFAAVAVRLFRAVVRARHPHDPERPA